ncbi:MAG: hypothetical protein QG597_3627 [Actinomycetota bacterium]|nr:hypothetical protein [Actinomycetota bacterium]
MAEYPGVVFKDGPSGRRAALAIGPDIWEVIKVLREIDERGEAAVTAAAEALVLPPAKVQLALTYYSGFPDEVDDEIAQAETASVAAEAAWESQRRLLA